MLKNQQQIHLKILLKEQFKKQEKQLVILLVAKFLIKSQKSQKIPKNNSEINEEEISKERYIYPEQRQDIIDEIGSI